jgi:hypothetical protein
MGQVLQQIQTRVLDPMFNQLLPHFDSPEARVMLLAIGLQESKFLTRRQYSDGPARGYWQAERGGSVLGVLTSSATRDYASSVCSLRNVAPYADAVWRKLEFDDLLAAAFARLTLWADPQSLPGLGRGGEAWDCYIRAWRPGRPHKITWNGCYAQALEAVRGA